MALVNIDSTLSDTIRYIKNCKVNEGLELMSYKRNRSVSIVRLINEKYLVKEVGYVEEDVQVEFNQLTKHLKKLIKREFPRSRKVRLFKFSDPSQLDRHHQKI